MDAKACLRGYESKHGWCSPKKKFISRGTHDKGEMFVFPTGNLKYIAFYLSFGEKPKVTGLTTPLTLANWKKLSVLKFEGNWYERHKNMSQRD